MKITQSYNIDLVPNGSPLVVNVSQYDKGSRTLEFHLFKDNVAYTPDAGVSANISGMKPDGTGFMYAMTVDGSVASVDVTEQMTAVFGVCPCEIRLVDTGGNILGSMNFSLAVEKAALDDEMVISDSDIPVFENLLSQAQTAAAEATDAASAASSLFPAGGSTGQFLQKTANGTQWADAQTETMVVTFTYSGGVYSADHTYAEIMANINAGGVPIGKYGASALSLRVFSGVSVTFGGLAQHGGDGRFTITSANAVSYSVSYIAPTYYANFSPGSPTADSSVYTNGYKVTLSDSSMVMLMHVEVDFPNDDYHGLVTWNTNTSGQIDLYFSDNPTGKSIRVVWTRFYYKQPTIS